MSNQGKKYDPDTPPTGMRTGYKYVEEQLPPREKMSSTDIRFSDAVMMKIDMMSSNQDRMIEKLDKVSDALYDPRDGLFMQIKEVEMSNKRIAEKLDAHVQYNDEESERGEGEITKIQKLIEPLPALIRWKERFDKSALWLVSGLGTALIGLIAKILYDFWATKHGLPPTPPIK